MTKRTMTKRTMTKRRTAMNNDYKATKDWDEDLQALIEEKTSLKKISYWAIRIQIVYSEKAKNSKGKPVIATIERVPDLYREITLLDYVIVIHKPCLTGFSHEQVKIALFEQLLKIQIDEEADGSEVHELALRGYDYEGFKEIIDEYGSDWDKPWSRQMTIDDIHKQGELTEA